MYIYIYILAEFVLSALSCQNFIRHSKTSILSCKMRSPNEGLQLLCRQPFHHFFSSRTPKCYAVILSNLFATPGGDFQQVMWIFPPPMKGDESIYKNTLALARINYEIQLWYIM